MGQIKIVVVVECLIFNTKSPATKLGKQKEMGVTPEIGSGFKVKFIVNTSIQVISLPYFLHVL